MLQHSVELGFSPLKSKVCLGRWVSGLGLTAFVESLASMALALEVESKESHRSPQLSSARNAKYPWKCACSVSSASPERQISRMRKAKLPSEP